MMQWSLRNIPWYTLSARWRVNEIDPGESLATWSTRQRHPHPVMPDDAQNVASSHNYQLNEVRRGCSVASYVSFGEHLGISSSFATAGHKDRPTKLASTPTPPVHAALDSQALLRPSSLNPRPTHLVHLSHSDTSAKYLQSVTRTRGAVLKISPLLLALAFLTMLGSTVASLWMHLFAG
ncbi:hypothetical protein LZ30DRAFT_741504 [Colletotrichum cereale]|nr:hypothetical protein LZ30DRAFT_741504 [Colletotrichum cereale]